MKYFSTSQIRRSLLNLRSVHPFFGFTFLAAKRAGLPVNTTTNIHFDRLTKSFLKKFFHPNPRSDQFIQPFKSPKQVRWLRPDYPSSGLQAINTQTFKDAFIHPPSEPKWGWSQDYVERLVGKLAGKRKLPLVDLAVWFNWQQPWREEVTSADVIEKFVNEFNINHIELKKLFTHSSEPLEFQDTPTTWDQLQSLFGRPPDVQPETGGALNYLEISNIGSVKEIAFNPTERLNILTGDNGLGKTFILDICWWALTGMWCGEPATPYNPSRRTQKPRLKFQIRSKVGPGDVTSVPFDFRRFNWPRPERSPVISGLIVYARVDGSFAVWDPIKVRISPTREIVRLTREEAWRGNAQANFEGLLRDWTKWQDNPGRYPFAKFASVLDIMSPPDLGRLEPAEPTRFPWDSKEIPQLRHRYGDVPIIFESAGVRRILTLAYLIVWAWYDHELAAEFLGVRPERQMVVLIDEIEAHLHPKWQRVILPAVSQIGDLLSSNLAIQTIVSTHSPLVMASGETVFDAGRDSLHHLNLTNDGEISFSQEEFVSYGRIDSWLRSEIFGLAEARNQDAESAIRDAIALQQASAVDRNEVEEISSRLSQLIPPEDRFWTRWIFFAKKYGVEL